MQTVNEHIRQHLLKSLRFPAAKVSLDTLRKTQWCDEYERYRRNRMLMGYFRYGDINRPGLMAYDCAEEVIKRVRRYQRDRNLEHLIDAGNCAMLAYMQGVRRGETMKTIDDGEHAQPVN